MMRLNGRYGHRSTLCRYAGIPEQKVHAIIPHGVYYGGDDFIPRSEQQVRLPVLSYPAYRDETYIRAGYRVVPSASPFVYALSLKTPAESGEGTLYFLAHSTPHGEVPFDINELRRQIDTLPQPVTVCLHPYDVRHKELFEWAGIPTTSAGRYTERDFLLNLIDMIDTHECTASGYIGTNVWYSLLMDRPFIPVGDVVTHRHEQHVLLTPDHEEHKRLADKMMRVSARLDPEEMRRVLTGEWEWEFINC